MANLVAEIGRLVERRAQCEQEIVDIDARLEAVRRALGGILPDRAHPVHYHPSRKRTSSVETRERIFAALAKCEPLTARHLQSETATSTAGEIARGLWLSGRLCRRADKRGIGRFGSYWYARSEAAFDGHPDCVETPCPPPQSNGNGHTSTDEGGEASAEAG